MLYVNVRGTGRLSSAPHGSSPTTLKKRGLVMDMYCSQFPLRLMLS